MQLPQTLSDIIDQTVAKVPPMEKQARDFLNSTVGGSAAFRYFSEAKPEATPSQRFWPTDVELSRFDWRIYDYKSAIRETFRMRIVRAGQSFITRQAQFSADVRSIQGWVLATFPQILQEPDGDFLGVWVASSGVAVIDASFHNGIGTLTLSGTEGPVSELEKVIEKAVQEGVFKYKDICVRWLYAGPHGVQQSVHTLLIPGLVEGAYPWLNGESIDAYAKRFLDSEANILLLQGPRGTGKTTFIKHLIRASGKDSQITYDPNVLTSDGFFIRFMEDKTCGLLIVEDNDDMLKARTRGNQNMDRILNVGDGLISVKNKKLVFTTNLDDLSQVDSALIRPGRCFDILKFRDLTNAEAKVVADGFYAEPVALPKPSYSLAEITNAFPKVPRKPPVFAAGNSQGFTSGGADLGVPGMSIDSDGY